MGGGGGWELYGLGAVACRFRILRSWGGLGYEVLAPSHTSV